MEPRFPMAIFSSSNFEFELCQTFIYINYCFINENHVANDKTAEELWMSPSFGEGVILSLISISIFIFWKDTAVKKKHKCISYHVCFLCFLPKYESLIWIGFWEGKQQNTLQWYAILLLITDVSLMKKDNVENV